MAILLRPSGVFVISQPEVSALLAAVEAALASPGSRTTRATIERWKELREALTS